VEDLVFGVSIISDIDEVLNNGSINFFVFTGNQHGSDTDQLQVLSGDLFFLKVPVNQIDGEVERFWHQLEFVMHVDEPVHENGPHLFVHIHLSALHVVCFGLGLPFYVQAVLEDGGGEVRTRLRVQEVGLVSGGQRGGQQLALLAFEGQQALFWGLYQVGGLGHLGPDQTLVDVRLALPCLRAHKCLQHVAVMCGHLLP